jgi:hypothetical protein
MRPDLEPAGSGRADPRVASVRPSPCGYIEPLLVTLRNRLNALRPAMAGESVDVCTDLLTARTVRPLSLPGAVTLQPARALELARAQLAAYTQVPSYRSVLDREGVADAADVAIIGDADYVTERLDALAAAGVDEFAAFVYGDPDPVQRTQDLLARLARADGGLAA